MCGYVRIFRPQSGELSFVCVCVCECVKDVGRLVLRSRNEGVDPALVLSAVLFLFHTETRRAIFNDC